MKTRRNKKIKNGMTRSQIVVFSVYAGALALVLTACTNSSLRLPISKSGDNTGDGNATSNQFKIANVTITAGTGGGGASQFETKVFFDSQQSLGPVNLECTAGTGSLKPCNCHFEWKEVNQTSGTAVSLPRSLDVPATNVQSFLVTCDSSAAFASVFTNEIVDGTKINVRVTAAYSGGNLTMKDYSVVKGATGATGDFSDQDGGSFQNIHRYSCYEKFRRGMTITNRTQDVADPQALNPDVKVPLASHYCVAKTQGSGGQQQGCDNTPPQQFSGQSAYYDLYVTSANKGNFTVENQRYACPLVKEPIDGSGGVGNQGQPYPLDTSFALRQNPSQEFSVGVEGPSVLGVANDPSTAPTSCFTSSSGGSSNSGDPAGISTKCLGYAMKPDNKGVCGAFTDSTGAIRQTFRLRRYLLIQRQNFDTDGKVITEPLGGQVIYVVDRPVKSSDPLKPFSMLGPKPCPSAYYDHRGALNLAPVASYDSSGAKGRPGYVGVNNALWEGKNADNIFLPNVDSESLNSCSASLPVIQYTAQGDPSFVTIATTHSSNLDGGGSPNTISLGGGRTLNLTKVYIRPISQLFPHYVEDTSFEACAPLSDPFRDPPLHFTKGSDGNVRWCAESYPTQNDAVAILDQKHDATPTDPPPGYVVPFTSHVAKRSNSAACTATDVTLPANYPADPSTGNCSGGVGFTTSVAGVAHHPDHYIVDQSTSAAASRICSNRTCDRTVVNGSSGSWKKFPLLAPPGDVEALLRSDSSYGCTITYDNNGGKTGALSPTDGCCGGVALDATLKTGGVGDNYTNAHLEPVSSGNACPTPDY